MRLQDSRKLGCPAKIFVRSITVYPDYDISDKAKTESRRHFDRFTKKEWLQKLKENIGNPDLKIFKRYYLCVPDQCAHTSHAVGVFAGLGQPINQKVKEQIHKLTNSGVSDVQTMRELLKDFILNDMFAHTSRKPDVLNTAFFPRDRCIANHMYIAATKQKLSCMDQVNLQQRIKEWEQQ
ncbi:calcium-responsive transcription factor-like [Rhopilema esculentum]|uniref:calcium-responsive transcription factor-like n=1 Tax=Rhopilema esculentum TaxID=499914 RepID=UPI0031DB8AF7